MQKKAEPVDPVGEGARHGGRKHEVARGQQRVRVECQQSAPLPSAATRHPGTGYGLGSGPPVRPRSGRAARPAGSRGWLALRTLDGGRGLR